MQTVRILDDQADACKLLNKQRKIKFTRDGERQTIQNLNEPKASRDEMSRPTIALKKQKQVTAFKITLISPPKSPFSRVQTQQTQSGRIELAQMLNHFLN